MLNLILFFCIVPFVSADIMVEPNFNENDVPIDNMIASSLWALSVCSCVGIVCNHKKKIPIKIQPKEEYGKELYEISIKNPDDLTKLKNDLQDMKRIVKNLEMGLKKKNIEKKNINNDIPEDIIYKFGEAPIRFKKNGKYYHGIDENFNASWDKTGLWTSEHIGCIWHYTNKNAKLPHSIWDTHDINSFCLNCSYEKEENKRKRKRFTYRCNGHLI